MAFQENRNVWDKHYQDPRSRQLIPDENIVRFFQRYLRTKPAGFSPSILEIGSGSGRNLSYLQEHARNVYGMDFAFNALSGQKNVICGFSHEVPFSDDTFDIVIAWGVLHYLETDRALETIKETLRILKPGGIFFGTIRSDEDTHLNQVLSTGDLASGSAHLYSESDVKNMLSDFSDLQTGYILRKNPGDEKIIAHHIIEARK